MITLPIIACVAVLALIIFLNEKYRLFSSDHFRTPVAKYAAYAWFAILCLVVTSIVVAGSKEAAAGRKLADVSFWSLFSFHVILIVFLAGWWVLSGMPPVRRFLNIRHESPAHSVGLGIAVGVGGWAATLALAAVIGLILTSTGMMPKNLRPSPMIPWMAGLAAWRKGLIVLTAGVVEEAFFRGWLQKRIGLVLSTIIFAIAHSGYGQPFMLVGVAIISTIIGITFYRTKNLVPCMIAHAVFDGIQLFIIVPVAVKFMGM